MWFSNGGMGMCVSEGHDPTNWENSLEERQKDERDVCPNCGEQSKRVTATFRNQASYVVCKKCRTPWPELVTEKKTRPMTPREMAKFVGGNMGMYLYKAVWWTIGDWTYMPAMTDDTDLTDWLYAENVPGDLEWKELPQMEAEG
jgi:predicted RNA-binding Zn-ribbon protein involved in translation (DUF1610 family)